MVGWEPAQVALLCWHCFEGQRKEDARVVVVEGLSLVAWDRHLIDGTCSLLLWFVLRDPEKSWPATGTRVKHSTESWSQHCKIAQERA